MINAKLCFNDCFVSKRVIQLNQFPADVGCVQSLPAT